MAEKNDLFIKTFVGDIPQPVNTITDEVSSEYLPANQYKAQQVSQEFKTYRPFIHSFNSAPLASESYILTEEIVLVYINLAGTGAHSIALNGSTDIISDGAVQGNFAIPYWRLPAGTILYSSVLNFGVHWIGFYLN